jgi:sulfopropanediol 3-dehydrogenase
MQYLKKAFRSQQVNEGQDETVSETVTRILADVRARGMAAVRDYSRRFDNFDPPSFRLSRNELDAIGAEVPEAVKADLAFAQAQIRNFAEAQRRTLRDLEYEPYPGIILGHKNIPIESVACYVPGGRYPLIASAHMGIITARVAEVGRVIAFTPPTGGRPHAATITAMDMAGADEIYLIGGAHALAAAAYGTEEIAPVNMLVGPGNAYVAEAKRQLFGRVGVDLFAGPTEVLIIADDSADAEMVAVDLLGQAEHGPDSPAVLITTSRTLGLDLIVEIERQLLTLETAEVAGRAWRDHGEIILVGDHAEAVRVADEIASEHVQILTRNADYYLDNMRNYGAIFLGEMTNVAYGDKVIGTNHVLPTQGAARYTGGLWVGKFIKTCTYQRVTEAGASAMIGEYGSRLCALESLAGHKRQNDLRVERFGNREPSAWRLGREPVE